MTVLQPLNAGVRYTATLLLIAPGPVLMSNVMTVLLAERRFPLILSIENHCTLPQQRNMAQAFKDIFSDALLTEPVQVAPGTLPSPNQLLGKVILKVIHPPPPTVTKTGYWPVVVDRLWYWFAHCVSA